MPTIKFHYPEHFTASRIRPNSNRKERNREREKKERDKEYTLKKKWMVKERDLQWLMVSFDPK